MPVMDEFKKERETLKDKPFRDKLSYFVTYYKWHVIGIISILALVIGIGRSMLNYKEVGMYGILLNAYATTLEAKDDFCDDFVAYSGFDTDTYNIDFEYTFRMGETMDSAGLSASQTIMVYIAAGDIDIMTMDTFNFNKYAYNGVYADLREILTEEELETYKDKLFYMDRNYYEYLSESSKDNTSLQYEYDYPVYNDPDSMIDPIPVGINLKDSEKFNTYFSYKGEDVYIGVLLNTKHRDTCKQLLDFLLKE